MSIVSDEEVIEKLNGMSYKERRRIFEQLKEPSKALPRTNGKKGYVSPDTIWMRDHSAPYAGQYVAVENGELVATGKGYPDTLANAKKAGAKRPLVAYVHRKDEEVWGGL
ncbi:hypothetical protein BH10ACI2_BH10ACI2_17330 [soil metagenome]